MFHGLLEFGKRIAAYPGWNAGRVLEIGSYNVNGSMRESLQEDSIDWVGVDLREGPCVDIVLQPHELLPHFGPESFDNVVCCEALEHDIRPWVTVEAMRSILKVGGHMLITTPTFGFPLHRFPYDCYRFGEDAYRLWMYDGYDLITLETIEDTAMFPCLAALGRKITP